MRVRLRPPLFIIVFNILGPPDLHALLPNHSMDPSNDLSFLFFSNDASSLSVPFSWLGPVALAPSSLHGQGLVTTRDVHIGECLFVMNPTAAADVATVKEFWQAEVALSLEQAAEQVLLEVMKQQQCVEKEDKSAGTSAASFLMLVGNNGKRVLQNEIHEADAIHTLVGSAHADDARLRHDDATESLVLLKLSENENERKPGFSSNDSLITPDNFSTDEETLLDIIRHNAFGPDFHNYAAMEATWAGRRIRRSTAPYARILGLYPLAAILNHSCASNAVRVFCGETMVVHATAEISKGDEIVWSYIPPIQPYSSRQSQLQATYGFQCHCARCRVESEVYANVKDLKQRLGKIVDCCDMGLLSWQQVEDSVTTLEGVLADPRLSHNARRYLRVGYVQLYISYFNVSLSRENTHETRKRILKLASTLHFSVKACHNACTEHLSILHLCYELARLLYATEDPPKVKFWVNQLMEVHMVRYGNLGENVEAVREAMKHSRGVLRMRDGLQNARYRFI